MSEEITGYQLSRDWFDFCFENPEKIRPIHTAIYFFAVEHCNRLGWKKKFGFPTQMAMEAIGIKNWRTYNSAFTELVDWGFIELIEKSKNQYSSCIICLCKKYNSTVESPTKSLDKALLKHGQKQVNISVGINKQLNNEPLNKEQSVTTDVDDVPNASDSETWQSATAIAEHLLESICEYDTTHRYNHNRPSLNSWVQDIDRALRLDGRTEEQMVFIIDYIYKMNRKHSSFWAGNIESGAKLRKQFDKIKNQIKSEKTNGRTLENYGDKLAENEKFLDKYYSESN